MDSLPTRWDIIKATNMIETNMEKILYRLTIVLASLVFLTFGLIFGYQGKQYLEHSQRFSWERLAHLEERERGKMTDEELALPQGLRPDHLNAADTSHYAMTRAVNGMQIAGCAALAIPFGLFVVYFGLRWVITGRVTAGLHK